MFGFAFEDKQFVKTMNDINQFKKDLQNFNYTNTV